MIIARAWMRPWHTSLMRGHDDGDGGRWQRRRQRGTVPYSTENTACARFLTLRSGEGAGTCTGPNKYQTNEKLQCMHL